MASGKMKYKNKTVKKYFVGLCIILAIIFLALYFYKWYSVLKQEKYYNSYLISTNTINFEFTDINEIQEVLAETANFYFLYISYTEDETVYNFEKELKPLIDEYQIQENFYFLNVTHLKDTDTDYKKDIAGELQIDEDIISDIPVILYFKDGNLVTTNGIHTVQEFADLLDTQDIKSQ